MYLLKIYQINFKNLYRYLKSYLKYFEKTLRGTSVLKENNCNKIVFFFAKNELNLSVDWRKITDAVIFLRMAKYNHTRLFRIKILREHKLITKYL